MPTDLRCGSTIRGRCSSYSLDKELGSDSVSPRRAFKAKDTKDGKPVFLKVYVNEPRTTDPRFHIFQKQQNAIYERLRDLTTVTENLYEDFLLDNVLYCSVKEFCIGKNVEALILDHDIDKLSAAQQLGLACSFAGVLKRIHSKDVVHTDLKPPQLFVSPDSCALGWTLKVKDFDVAHVDGVEPYNVTGTQFYYSPEHLRHERTIKSPSDVFTCGIILVEILTGALNVVYDVGDVDDVDMDTSRYKKLVLAYSVNPAPLDVIRKVYKEGSSLADTIYRMLNPDPRKRPSIIDVHKAVLDAYKMQQSSPSSTVSAKSSVATPMTTSISTGTTGLGAGTLPPPHTVPATIQFSCDGQVLIAYESKAFGRNSFRVFGRDKYQYADNEQFTVTKSAEGWRISGKVGVPTPTKLNGEVICGEERLLKNGDQVQVGPLTFSVRLK